MSENFEASSSTNSVRDISDATIGKDSGKKTWFSGFCCGQFTGSVEEHQCSSVSSCY